ncbi:MAG: potassium-transporting ATPase subunit B, partial [Gemmatimonadaceae bacterium]|nr:potassium-transporting ATPase subunit B [Acetobacteraceae bacterium]
MAQNTDVIALFDGAIIGRAARDAFVKLNPARLIRNPVIFVTEIVSILVTVLAFRNLATGEPAGFALAIS